MAGNNEKDLWNCRMFGDNPPKVHVWTGEGAHMFDRLSSEERLCIRLAGPGEVENRLRFHIQACVRGLVQGGTVVIQGNSATRNTAMLCAIVIAIVADRDLDSAMGQVENCRAVRLPTVVLRWGLTRIWTKPFFEITVAQDFVDEGKQYRIENLSSWLNEQSVPGDVQNTPHQTGPWARPAG